MVDTLSIRLECFFCLNGINIDNGSAQPFRIQTFQIINESNDRPPKFSKAEEQICDIAKVKFEYATDLITNFVGNIRCMYEQGLLSDFTLSSGKKEFKVHKNILSARSPVFRAMFTSDMKERDGNSVEIPDVEPDILQRMLLFVYSGRIEEGLEWENAMKLYFAADKYGLEELKRANCAILKAGLEASNACEILVHADLHGDQDLKSCARNFIVDHDKEVIGSEDWKKLSKDLTIEIFTDLYEKKMKC